MKQINDKTHGYLYEQGVALLTILVIVVFVSVVATIMLAKQQTSVQETNILFSKNNMLALALSSEKTAMVSIYKDMDANKADGFKDNWAGYKKTISKDGIQATSRIQDLSGRYNINNVHMSGKVVESQKKYFERLLGELGLEKAIADSVIDWQDSDDEPISENGAESDYYASKKIIPANQDFHSVQELSKVKGVTDNAMQVLQKNIITLPRKTKININTATFSVITALSSNIDRSSAAKWVEERKKNASIEKLDDIYGLPTFSAITQKEKKQIAELLSTQSALFLIKTEVTYDKKKMYLYSFVFKQDKALTVYQRISNPFELVF